MAKRKQSKKITDLPTDDFSARAMRSFARSLFTKIGHGLLDVAGYEVVPDEELEAEESLPLDPEEQAAAVRQAERTARLEEWRQKNDRIKLMRLARKEEYESLQKIHSDRVSQLIKEAQKHAKAKPAPDISEIKPPEEAEHTATETLNTIEPEPRLEVPAGEYRLPTVELFDQPETEQVIFIDPEELERQKTVIQETLDSFAVDATVWDAIVGPRITQLRLRPGLGVRVESITSLNRNFALALSAESVRMQAPIPGKPYVGIEIPNGNTATLPLSLLLRSEAWHTAKADIPLVLGMELGGSLCITDLAAAPHMLIAGATGSGKSVCMNTLLMCLLCRFSPDELELVLIDPKRVEFGAYSTLPHLIRPVVTEAKMVVPALQGVVREMERRYEILSTVKARNISTYNERMEELGQRKMPYLVVIIDELADIMLTAGAEVETALARIAQLSRAVGIHTIIATQRPSVNVLTGMIKANYPTRVAFKVSSQIDSRTILDSKGAEALRGRGDMLFSPPGIGQLTRVQAPWVSEIEVERVVNCCAEQRLQSFREINVSAQENTSSARPTEIEETDPLLEQAIEIILRDHRATTSYLQRCLRVGYNRAANLIEELEARGIVGPQIGSTPREILIDSYDGGAE